MFLIESLTRQKAHENIGVPSEMRSYGFHSKEAILDNARLRRKGGLNSRVLEQLGWRDRLNYLLVDIAQKGDEWNKVTASEKDISNLIFNYPPIGYDFLATRRRLTDVLTEAHAVNLRNPFATPANLNQLDHFDIYQEKINGVTLLDIEGMPLPLGVDDIKTVNRFTRTMHFGMDRLRPKEFARRGFILQFLPILATSRFAHPEKSVTIPKAVKPLYRRMVDYYDYYTSLMLSDDLTPDEDFSFFINLYLCGSNLIDALGSYLPARLGISPASATKVYLKHAEVSPLGSNKWGNIKWRRTVLGRIYDKTKNAVLSSGLPADLSVYQHFDGNTDQVVAKTLSEFYSGSAGDLETDLNSETATRELRQFHDRLVGDIRSEAVHRMIMDMPDGYPVSRIILTNQYPQTLIAILQFENNSHLTLELAADVLTGGDYQLFGMPNSLMADNPHFSDLVTQDIFSRILGLARSRYQLPAVIHSLGQAKVEEPMAVTALDRIDEEPKQPKKLRNTLVYQFGEPPQMPKRPTESPRKFKVIHSRTMLRGMVGKNTPDEILNQLMGKIRDFEFGKSPIYRELEAADKVRELRSGNYRIIIEHRRGGLYSLVDAGSRGEIFKKHRVSPASFN